MLSLQRVQSLVREIKSRKTEQPRRKETAVTAPAFCPLQLPAKSLAMMDARMNVLTRHLETQPYPVLDSGAVSGKHQETARSTGCPGRCMQRCFTSRRAPRKQEKGRTAVDVLLARGDPSSVLSPVSPATIQGLLPAGHRSEYIITMNSSNPHNDLGGDAMDVLQRRQLKHRGLSPRLRVTAGSGGPRPRASAAPPRSHPPRGAACASRWRTRETFIGCETAGLVLGGPPGPSVPPGILADSRAVASCAGSLPVGCPPLGSDRAGPLGEVTVPPQVCS